MESPQVNEQAEPNTSLRDELVRALNEAENEANEPKAENENNEEEASQSESEEAETQSDEAEESLQEEVIEEEAEESQEDEQDEVEDITEKEFPLVPNNWSKEEKEAFQKLIDSDDEDKRMAAEIMLERYNSFKKTFFDKTQEYSKNTKELKSINDVFAPVQQMMQANNVDKASYIKNMMQWESILARDPVNGVKAVMAKFNVKPSQIAPKDDEFDLDDDDLTEPSNNVNNNYASKQELQEIRTAIANQPLMTQIAQFANATDSTGKSLHPRFEEVKPIMGQIIQSKKAATLEDAYRKAIKVIDDEEPQQESAVDIDKIRQKVKRAKKASKGIKTSGSKADVSQMSIRDELIAKLSNT